MPHGILAFWLTLGLLSSALAQGARDNPQSSTVPTSKSDSTAMTNSSADAASSATQPAPLAITVPAGTKVPLVLRNTVNTKNALPGDNVYCQTNFPVTQNSRVVIPAGTYVQGVINKVDRAGRVKGRAEVQIHFTTMIFPNGYTMSLPGTLENASGVNSAHMKDKEGTVEADSQKGQTVGTIAGTAASGTIIGGLSRGAKGGLIGAGIGGAAGTAIALLTKKNEVRMEPGTTVEMILQRPLALEQARVNNPSSPQEFAPVSRSRTLDRPELTPSPGAR